jgi:hypothetical protein
VSAVLSPIGQPIGNVWTGITELEDAAGLGNADIDPRISPYNIFRYRAVGDVLQVGETLATDDTAAFLRAMSIGAPIWVPPGYGYAVADTLQLWANNQQLYSHGAVLLWKGTSGNWIEFADDVTLENAWLDGFELRLGNGASYELDWYISMGRSFHCGIKNIYTKFHRGVINEGFIRISSDGSGGSYSVGPELDNITMTGAGAASGPVAQWGLLIEGCIEGQFRNVTMYDCDRTLQIGPSDVSRARAVANLDFHGCEFQILSNTDGSDGDADSRSVVITFGQEINFFGGRLGRGASTAGSTDWGDSVDFVPLSDAAFGVIRNVNFYGVDMYGLQKGRHALYFADPGAAPSPVGIAIYGGQLDGWNSDPIYIDPACEPEIYLDPGTHVSRSSSAALDNYPSNALRVTALTGGDTLPLPISGWAYEIALSGTDTITAFSGHRANQRYQLQFANGNATIDFTQVGIVGNGEVSKAMGSGSRLELASNGSTAYCLVYE